ncbi:carbohydrate binding family 9 domain-containing protein [Reichenbachiella carrageenanivorans]|uniref:Carbohydrate binding family 9 domain-containing protein n=1 Tax=Reichenbachiella carrageenanivorans TaxID=2979869 RepID=A0ABY6CWE1_9BACT|nr:carbohydrate binding family 9 domain-containing protein [Reichenbachiella carrageenanivorans]UXX78232.1 carbohydrate binding family 9 domain-containing protein [Reichenbachiella carrageenanivorans]
MIQKLLTIIFMACIVLPSFGQDLVYRIQKTDVTISVDGVLNEPVWQSTDIAQGFNQYFPNDSSTANSQTEVRLAYDDQFLYFSAKMYNQSDNRKYVVPSLRRDFEGDAIDGISLIFDTFQDNTNAFQFGVNSYGVQREGLIAGGFGDTSWSWDNKWYAEAKQYSGYWVAEGAIPFKSIRFKEGKDQWNINFYRLDSEAGEQSTWQKIPRNYDINSLAFMGILQWDQPLEKPGSNISIIPYTATEISRDYQNSQQNGSISKVNFGGDAKIAIGSGLNLDLTVNPDFSQVEVDQQVTNLDRFELFFPEKRQFFLENADLFANFGHPYYARTFFSRRIGIVNDTINDLIRPNKILYGARLSGKLDNNWRVGLLNMQTEAIEDINLPGFNYSVAALQRKVFARSNIGAIFVNKQSFDAPNDNPDFAPDHYNRVLGFDYNLASADNKWVGKTMYQQSWDSDSVDGGDYAHSFWLAYQGRKWRVEWAHTAVGENFNAEVGFVPRNGLFRIENIAARNFYPTRGAINFHQTQVVMETLWGDTEPTRQRVKSDQMIRLDEYFQFQNTSQLNASLRRQYTYLLDPFDPTNTDGQELSKDSQYTYHYLWMQYDSDLRKKLTYSVVGQLGEYFNGYRYRLGGDLSYRIQPFAAFNININYNKLNMPEPYTSVDLILIGSRVDFTMTKKLFLTSFLQYNTQAENFNINTRLQWRFKPVSDLFIVYTDNYATMDNNQNFDLQEKNRALVVKLTYWLNL